MSAQSTGADDQNEYQKSFNAGIALASVAMKAARCSDIPAVAGALKAMFDMDTPETSTVMNAVVFWVDALRYHMLGGLTMKVEVIGPGVVMSDETGKTYCLGSAEADTQLRPSVRWASEIVDARMSNDLPRFRRVWERAPDGGREWPSWVADLLFMTAGTIEGNEFGYALKGARFE